MNIDDLTIGQARDLAGMFGGSSDAPTQKHDSKPVVIWTEKRGVIFGYTEDTQARPITLTEARMCLYWPASVGGVFGLCDFGPNSDTKVSAALPSAEFEGVTGVASVSDDALKAWLNAPVQGR